MKIRTGFVSNSSSSSFTIFGFGISYDQFLTEINADEKTSDDFYDDPYEFLDQKTSKHNLGYEIDSDNDLIYIGDYPDSVEDDVTFGEFKQRTRKNIEEAFGIVRDCEWITEEIAS